MSDNLPQTIALVFGSEGGYVNHPKDPGGATKYGITAATLGAWRKLGRKATPSEVKLLTVKEAAEILDVQYAQPLRYKDLPAGVDYCLFDFSTNSGPSQAVKTLQQTLGIEVDGQLGIKTLNAIAARNVVDVINNLCDARMRFLRRLATYKTFGDGWSTRVAHVRKTAIAMALAGTSRPGTAAAPPPPKPAVITDAQPVTPPAGMESARPEQTKATATTGVKANIGVAIGIGTTAVASAKEIIAPVAGHGDWFYDHLFQIMTTAGIALAIAGVVVVAVKQYRAVKSGAVTE